jgi:hypothetical protein
MASPAAGQWIEFTGVYAGGLDGHPPRKGEVFSQNMFWNRTYRMNESGVEIVCKHNRSLAVKQSVARQSWENLDRLLLAPSHTTSNQGAILMFGALGLASRITWMLMDVRFTRDAVFDTPLASRYPHALFAVNVPPHDISLSTEELERHWPQASGKFRLVAKLPPFGESISSSDTHDANPSGTQTDMESA